MRKGKFSQNSHSQLLPLDTSRHDGDNPLYRQRNNDNMQFIHKFTCLLMQIKALNISLVCMFSYFEYISIILYNFK